MRIGHATIEVTRRRILVSGALLAVGAALLPLIGKPIVQRMRDPDDHIADALTTLSRMRDRSVAIGQRYLRDHPDIGDRTRVLTRLRSRFGPPPSSAPGPTLEQRIRKDFAVGDVVAVDGWLLSRTEADLCALLALAGP